MAVSIIIFGQLTDITNAAKLQLEKIADTDELTKQLHEKYPALASSKYVIAVNKKVIESNTKLDYNSTVALLPPFSGG